MIFMVFFSATKFLSAKDTFLFLTFHYMHIYVFAENIGDEKDSNDAG